jgi:hypothetical protein
VTESNELETERLQQIELKVETEEVLVEGQVEDEERISEVGDSTTGQVPDECRLTCDFTCFC